MTQYKPKEDVLMTTNTNNPAGKYASVNGINLYYEIHGTGKPLIMLHGGFGTFEMFTALSPALALDHQVIQKILPRLHGSRRRLENTLCSVGHFCFDLVVEPPGSETAISFDPVAPPEGNGCL